MNLQFLIHRYSFDNIPIIFDFKHTFMKMFDENVNLEYLIRNEYININIFNLLLWINYNSLKRNFIVVTYKNSKVGLILKKYFELFIFKTRHHRWLSLINWRNLISMVWNKILIFIFIIFFTTYYINELFCIENVQTIQKCWVIKNILVIISLLSTYHTVWLHNNLILWYVYLISWLLLIQ